MSALPTMMQIKKDKLEATLPPLAQVKPTLKPVVVNSQVEKKEDKKEEEKLDLEQFTVGKEVAEDADSLEIVKPVVTEVKEKVEDDDESKRDWRWMYKSLEGNHQSLIKENRDLRDKFVELETKFGLIDAKKPEVKVNEPSLELTEEELTEYGAALPMLNKLLLKQQRQIEQGVVTPLQREIAELKKSNNDVALKAAASDEGTFVQQVRMQIKNIGGDFDAILKDPKWSEFTNRAIGPYADITIGQALWDAHKKRDLGKVVKVFEDFTKPQVTVSAGDAYRVPAVSAANGALPNDGKKPMLKLSKRREASEQFRKRQITAEKYEKIRDLYREAEVEGRIDFDT